MLDMRHLVHAWDFTGGVKKICGVQEAYMKRALIIIDYQTDFVAGSLGFPAARALEAPICSRIDAARRAGDDVIFTMDTHSEDYLQTREGRALPIIHCIKGTPGWALFGRVAEKRTRKDTVIEKNAFGSLAFAKHLQHANYSSLTFCGVITEICVLSAAVLARAALPESEVIIDAACTAGPDPNAAVQALNGLEKLQMQIVNCW